MTRKKIPTKNYHLSLPIESDIKWFRKKLRTWFRQNKRSFYWREFNRSPYEILVAEILLRRTQARTVAKYYQSFLTKYPDFQHLAKSSTKELHKTLKPLGLWRQKAPIFKAISKKILLNDGQLPDTREELEKLEHVGQYIASVILTTLHGKAEPFIDVNMARVVDRFFGPRKLVDIRYDPYLHAVARSIVKNPKESLVLNWAVLDFAALVCKAQTPLCLQCPMQEKCFYYNCAKDRS